MKQTRRIPVTNMLPLPLASVSLEAKLPASAVTRAYTRTRARIKEPWEAPIPVWASASDSWNEDDGASSAVAATPALTIRITTLGPFMVYLPTARGLQTATWRDERTRTVLKCLLAAPTYWLTREQVIELLWPELDLRQGQDALRHTLARLRRTLEPERMAYDRSSYLASDRDALWLVRNPEDEGLLRIWVDRDHFERLAPLAIQHLEQASNPQRLQRGQLLATQALQIYGDHFLPTDQYADWTQATRSRCQRLWTTLLWQMANIAVLDRNLDRALLVLGQLVDVMPDDERAVAQLMRVQAACGKRGEALRTYHALVTHLATELGAAPMDELQLLANTIRAGTTSLDELFHPAEEERHEG